MSIGEHFSTDGKGRRRMWISSTTLRGRGVEYVGRWYAVDDLLGATANDEEMWAELVDRIDIRRGDAARKRRDPAPRKAKAAAA